MEFLGIDTQRSIDVLKGSVSEQKKQMNEIQRAVERTEQVIQGRETRNRQMEELVQR